MLASPATAERAVGAPGGFALVVRAPKSSARPVVPRMPMPAAPMLAYVESEVVPRRDQDEPLWRQASMVEPLTRRRKTSPAASSWLTVRRLTIAPLSTRSKRIWSVPASWLGRSM